MITKGQKGQALIIIVLVVLIAITIGVAVSSQALISNRETVSDERSSEAYTAAEAGSEVALKNLVDTPWGEGETTRTGNGDFQSGTPNESSYNYTISPLGTGIPSIYESRIEKDDVVQVNLTGVPQNYKVNIFWWNEDISQFPDPTLDCIDDANGVNGAALEFTYLAHQGSEYKVVKKEAFEPCSRSNNFNAVSASSYLSSELATIGRSDTYSFYAKKSAETESVVLGNDTEALIRIRSWYNNTRVAVQLLTNTGTPANIPVQGYEITSIGSAGTNKRTVKITKTSPYLPAIFDYVLFSGGDLQK